MQYGMQYANDCCTVSAGLSMAARLAAQSRLRRPGAYLNLRALIGKAGAESRERHACGDDAESRSLISLQFRPHLSAATLTEEP
jgi:hypothetical protein